MPDQFTSTAQIATAIELALAVIGSVLAWRLSLRPAARAGRVPPLLPHWEVGTTEFALYFLHALFGWFIAGLVVALVSKPLGFTPDRQMIFGTGMADLGLIAGLVLFAVSYPRRLQLRIGAAADILRSGIATFLIACPFVLVVSVLWRWVLDRAGIPAEKQDVIALFERTESPAWSAAFGLIAIGMAPIAEEMLFRAGLFRFLRTRAPRWVGLILPACFFAALHNLSLTTFAPLATLGLIFALAYERTGCIGTAIIAHAVFNLNNVLLLLAGVNN